MAVVMSKQQANKLGFGKAKPKMSYEDRRRAEGRKSTQLKALQKTGKKITFC